MSSTSSGGNRPFRIALVVLVALLVLSAVAAGNAEPAAAGGPGVWTDLSGPVGSLLVQPDAARGSGGMLHVVWASAGTPEYLHYRPVTASGAAGADRVLTPGGWGIVNDPAVITDTATGSSVQVFTGGQNPGATISGLARWSSSDNGSTFSPGALVTTAGSSWSSAASAVATPGAALQTWANTYGVYTHRGEAAGVTYDVNDVGMIGYDPAFGYDAAGGRLYVVAFYNETGKEGLWARRIDPATGAPVGSSFALANSWTMSSGVRAAVQKNTRTPVTGLAGQSVVVVAYPTGYPTSTTMRVWRLTPAGQSNVVLAKGGSEKDATAVAADGSGRVWVVWTDKNGARRKVYAVRSNVGATAWGQIVSLAGPSGASTLWQLAASAQAGRVDVLAQYEKGSGYDIFHTQLLAGLTVRLSPAKVKVGTTVTVKVTVLDAGAAVAGAKVTIGTKSATTSSTGVAKVKVKATKAGKLTVSVKKSGYTKGSATLKVTR